MLEEYWKQLRAQEKWAEVVWVIEIISYSKISQIAPFLRPINDNDGMNGWTKWEMWLAL